jgi:ABC-2 type transport system permease protein
MSWPRFLAILIKELRQLRRDRLTFAMMVGVPVLQLVLFGFAINTDPRHLPLAVVVADESEFTRSLVAGLENSAYFHITHRPRSEAEGSRLLAQGQVQFLLVVPPHFTRALLRGERPAVLLAADASDPAASGNALAGLNAIGRQVLVHNAIGVLDPLGAADMAFEIRVQRRYNPEGVSQYNIVPGLIGVILTMTMVMMTSLTMTRERERGTMESLLATPVRPLEVMAGKIVPYILIGYVQAALILLAARWLFDVPMAGSLGLLSATLGLFMAANLAVGFTFSTIVRNQLQAMQLTYFYFLPSILLSGFMFPFRGMPQWAQAIGEALPLTHFLRIVRGIMLKGNGGAEIAADIWPLAAFALTMSAIALNRYRQTLD